MKFRSERFGISSKSWRTIFCVGDFSAGTWYSCSYCILWWKINLFFTFFLWSSIVQNGYRNNVIRKLSFIQMSSFQTTLKQMLPGVIENDENFVFYNINVCFRIARKYCWYIVGNSYKHVSQLLIELTVNPFMTGNIILCWNVNLLNTSLRI